MILKGFMGTVYVRIEETSRIDLWRTDTWLTQTEVLDEILKSRGDILEQLAVNSEDYGGYDTETGEADPDNKGYLDMFEKMIDDIRACLDGNLFDDSFEDVEINISPQRIHLPEMSEYEWAGICETKTL